MVVMDSFQMDQDLAIYTSTRRLSIMANGTIAFDTLTTSDSVNNLLVQRSLLIQVIFYMVL